MINIVQKSKLRAEKYIFGALITSFFSFALFFRLEALLLLIVYPFVALFFYGILKIINGVGKRNRGDGHNLNRVLLGIISILFSLALLYFIIMQPNISTQNLINISVFPIIVIGFAGIVKGRFISIYSKKWRIVNIGIGSITMFFSMATLISSYFIIEDLNLFHIIFLPTMLLVNIVCRAALYLSEYGLSLIHLKNFKIFFYIISDYLIFVNHEGNIVLEKMEA
jgi:hypothetical protein